MQACPWRVVLSEHSPRTPRKKCQEEHSSHQMQACPQRSKVEAPTRRTKKLSVTLKQENTPRTKIEHNARWQGGKVAGAIVKASFDGLPPAKWRSMPVHWSMRDELPEKCKQIFKLSKKEGLTNIEIADYLQISIKTVEAQISIAFSKIRKDLLNK